MKSKTDVIFRLGAVAFLIIAGLVVGQWLRDQEYKQERSAQEMAFMITENFFHGKTAGCWIAKTPFGKSGFFNLEKSLYYDVDFKAIKDVWERGEYSVEKFSYGIEICPIVYSSSGL